MPDRLRRPYLLLRRVMALLCTTALLGLPLVSPLAGAATATAAKDIRLRRGPGLKTPAVGVLVQGEAVTVIGQQGIYAQVRTAQGQTGYLRAKHLREVDAEAVAVLAPFVLRPEQLASAPPASIPAVVSAGVAPAPRAPVPAREPAPSPAGASAVPGPAVVPSAGAAPTASGAPTPAPSAAPRAAAAPSRWRLSAGAGSARSGVRLGELQAALDAGNTGVAVNTLEYTGIGGSAWLGYAVLPGLALDAGYLELGRYDARIAGNGTRVNTAAAEAVLARRYPVGGPGVALAARAFRAIGPFELYARAGVFHGLHSDLKLFLGNTGTALRIKGDDLGPLLGLGADYALDDHWGIGVGLDAMQLNDRLYNLNATVVWRP